MSIEKAGFSYDLICDVCGEIGHSTFDFHDAVQFKKVEGWKSQKDSDGDWEDVCPDCQRGEL